MTDTPPDRLSTNPRSPHFDMEVLQRGIGIRFKGQERTDVEEYSISEGWIRGLSPLQAQRSNLQIESRRLPRCARNDD